jgi:glyoxylase-like metal-dependent hydrolase (beta-lactamase superfamily II)
MNRQRRTFLKTLGLAGATVPLVSVLGSMSSAVVRAQSTTLGQVVVMPRGNVTLHTYRAPEPSALVTSHIIETANALVIVDTQFIQTFGRDFATYVENLGKPVERVILSHSHPDHWLAGNNLSAYPFVTTANIANEVQAAIDGGTIENLANLVGSSEVPTEAYVPQGTIIAGSETIDGVEFVFEIITQAEATEHLLVRLPEFGVVVVQDLIYNDAHFFPGVDRENWIRSLEALRADDTYEVYLVGHGLPATRGELDNAIAYLSYANEVSTTAQAGQEIADALAQQYPSYGGLLLLTFWQQMFMPS